MTGRSEENTGLPGFFRDNPWLGILAQREAEPTPNSMVSQAFSSLTVSKAMPSIESEPIASSPATFTAISFPKELVVRLMLKICLIWLSPDIISNLA